MKWKDLTPDNLRSLASDMFDTAHDHEIDRESMLEEQGFDVVAAEESLARFLKREAKRRENRTGPPPLDGEAYDATFHRIQDGYADGWPRAVFVDSDGEPVGVRCGPHEAAAIAAGAAALIEAAALRKIGEAWKALARAYIARDRHDARVSYLRGCSCDGAADEQEANWTLIQRQIADAKDALRALGVDPDSEAAP